MILRILFLSIAPLFLFAQVSNTLRVGNTTISNNGKNSVNGTLLGYKRHAKNKNMSFAVDVNQVIVEKNNYGIDDTTEFMVQIGVLPIDSLEIFGSYGYATEDNHDGFGWGAGIQYDINENFSLTYEYRTFDMDGHDLDSSSFGILIGF